MLILVKKSSEIQYWIYHMLFRVIWGSEGMEEKVWHVFLIRICRIVHPLGSVHLVEDLVPDWEHPGQDAYKHVI